VFPADGEDSAVVPICGYPARYSIGTEDEQNVQQLTLWTTTSLPFQHNPYLKPIRNLQPNTYCDLLGQVLSVEELHHDPRNGVLLRMWDGTDETKLEWGTSCDLSYGSRASPKSVVGVVVRPHLYQALNSMTDQRGEWLFLRNVFCRQMDRLLVETQDKTKWRAIREQEVASCHRNWAESGELDIPDKVPPIQTSHSDHHCLDDLPLPAFSNPTLASLSESTISQILAHPQPTMLFSCRARVIGHVPSDVRNFTCLNTQTNTHEYKFTLILADATGELTLRIFAEDGDHLLGVGAANLKEDEEHCAAVRLQVDRMVAAEEPFLCHLQSYYVDKHLPEKRGYRLYIHTDK